MTETTTKKGGVIMDPKEQELIDARVEAYCDWAKAERKWIETCRNWDEACRKLWKYQESKAQQGGKVGE